MNAPIKLYDESTPNWLRTICPKETPREKYERSERELKKAEQQKRFLEEAYKDKMEDLDNRLLFLMDLRLQAINEIEATGDEV